MITVDSEFPTGNGLVLRSTGDRLLLDRDLRDSLGERWYWHVRVRAAEEASLTVEMARAGLLGAFGPAVRRGRTHGWLSPLPLDDGGFTVELPADSWVYLSATPSYGPAALRRFRARLGAQVTWHRLCRSERGRSVPLISAGQPNAQRLVLLTARHHACEAVASYVLDGAVEAFLTATATTGPARHYQLLAVPLVDIDGVCIGDQGKGREPWDHNRDYGPSSRYRTVAALRQLLSEDLRPTVALDFHTPGLRGPLEERPYVIASGDTGDEQAALQLLATLAVRQVDTTERAELLVFDQSWNSAHSNPRCFAAWMRGRPNTELAFTVEYPNAVLRGTPVTPARARRFGAAILESLLTLP